MRRRDHIAFKNLAQLPAGHDVRDATVLLHGANDDLGNQFAVAADQQFTVLQHTLFITNVQHDKIPSRIHHNHLAFEVGTEFHDIILVSKEFVQLILNAEKD